MKEYITRLYDILMWVYRAYILWAYLLSTCEISNSYYRAITRFGLIFLSVLSNVDRKYYYQFIQKKKR